ncbi:MAG: SpoIID/LytB domain-containing protein [Bryobacteraceae bacterium]
MGPLWVVVLLSAEVTVKVHDRRTPLRLDLEDYVVKVLSGESGGFTPEEAQKAMAVAVRTYAFRFRGRHESEGYDFCETTHCQDYRPGMAPARLHEAVKATAALMVWYRGSPASTFYTANCGGQIESAAVAWPGGKFEPYLHRRRDPYCLRVEWDAKIPKSALGGPLVVLSRTPSGRVSQVRIGTRVGAIADLRSWAGKNLGWNVMRSDLFEVRTAGDQVLLHGRGAGHGVGLCQAGAEQMGKQGLTFRKILDHYYPGTVVSVHGAGFEWKALGGERVEVLTTEPNSDQRLVAMADRLANELERSVTLRYAGRPRIEVYPSVATFRDATGESGRVAGSTRGSVVRLQPAGKTEGTLRHELAHVLIEQNAKPGLPDWFREGLARQLAGERQRDRVKTLIERHGRETVVRWVTEGLPPAVVEAQPGPSRSRKQPPATK